MTDFPKLPINRPLLQGNFEWNTALILKTQREQSPTIPGPEYGPGVEALAAVAVERIRQVWEEGWTLPHDIVNHPDGQLALAAAAMICEAQNRKLSLPPVNLVHHIGVTSAQEVPTFVDQDIKHLHAQPAPRLLVQAVALLVAELDRLLETGEAFICDRCGQVYDANGLAEIMPVQGEVPEGEVAPGQLRYGETQICTYCYGTQLEEEARSKAAQEANNA